MIQQTGGVQSPVIVWVALAPIAATLLFGFTSRTVFWLLMTLGAVSVFGLLPLIGIRPLHRSAYADGKIAALLGLVLGLIAVAALMAGEIDVLFDNIPNILGQIKAGTALIPIKRRRILLLHKIDETGREQQISFTQTSGQQLVSLPQILFGLTKLLQSGVSTRRQYQPITLMPGRCTAEPGSLRG